MVMNTGIIRCEPCNTSFPISLNIIKAYGIKCGCCGSVLLKGSKYITTPRSGRVEANA